MAIKLEVGKKYELNNGEVHECTRMVGEELLAIDDWGFGPFVINEMRYHHDGTFAARGMVQEYHGVKRCVSDDPKIWLNMTPKEKGALMLAHHEGKVIELYDPTVGGWVVCTRPTWAKLIAYRVKPEPVRETVQILTDGTAAELCDFFKLPEISKPTHRITFDMIDGEPDCNSIKMEKL